MNSQDEYIPCVQPRRDAASNTSNFDIYVPNDNGREIVPNT